MPRQITYSTAVKNAVLNGDLVMLLGDGKPDSVPTPLQQTVLGSAGVLCTATLATLKATHPDYADIDVAQIMSEFSIPSVV